MAGKNSSASAASSGVFEWFIDPAWGGQAWSEADVVRGYLALSTACITTTFILTQRTGACRRIEGCQNTALKERLLPGLARGDLFATVGISHLTTSRRHLAKPVLTAEAIPGGFRLEGMSPWVTGAAAADVIVMAAVLVENGTPTDKQLLIAVPNRCARSHRRRSAATDRRHRERHRPRPSKERRIDRRLADCRPATKCHVEWFRREHRGLRNLNAGAWPGRCRYRLFVRRSQPPPDLTEPATALRTEHQSLLDDLLHIVHGESACTKESLRQRANSLVLRADASRAIRGKRFGLRRRPSRRPLVPRGVVLPRLELPTTGSGCEPMRTSRNCVLMETTSASILLAVGASPRSCASPIDNRHPPDVNCQKPILPLHSTRNVVR